MLLIKKISLGIILGYSSISMVSATEQMFDYTTLNNNASCDSTCSLHPDKVKTLSGQNQRLSSCGYGYTGSSLEDRVLQIDGSWSDWRLVNRDNCSCTPLTEEQEISCPENQRGQHIEKRSWTCPTVQLGEYTSWTTKNNTCDYYYLSTSTEEQTVACPDNQRGTHVQTRNFENWSDGNKKNYTTWSTKSNTCDYYVTAASQTEYGTDACPSGYTGTINKVRTYNLMSSGNKIYTTGWSETSRNCVSTNFTSNIGISSFAYDWEFPPVGGDFIIYGYTQAYKHYYDFEGHIPAIGTIGSNYDSKLGTIYTATWSRENSWTLGPYHTCYSYNGNCLTEQYRLEVRSSNMTYQNIRMTIGSLSFILTYTPAFQAYLAIIMDAATYNQLPKNSNATVKLEVL